MTAISTTPAKRRLRRPPLRVQLTVLYAGLFVLLLAAVLAISGLLVRQESTNTAVLRHHTTPSSATISMSDRRSWP